ncbi:unnamed protein product, partial [Laminaria digitata]
EPGKSTACCRYCTRVFHLRCAGYHGSSTRTPPPDWICADCPGGTR